jgi:hypothetical protein
MIGVIAEDGEARAVQEFFELFKTPWEFYSPECKYEMVLATADDVPEQVNARLLVIYNSRRIAIDNQLGITLSSTERNKWVKWQNAEWPVYGNLTRVSARANGFLQQRESNETVGLSMSQTGRRTVRIGIDLFSEVEFLIRQGQPADNAHVPTLEFHISLLRAIIVSSGIPFIEIPPAPSGYELMACLTHDVDFVGIRDHKLDPTMFGFLYRCFVGSLVRALRKQLPWSKCLQNWKAGLSLPLVHVGLAEDFWLEFDRYTHIEKGLGSTFFFIPFKGRAGGSNSGPAPDGRAAKYDVGSLTQQLYRLIKNGCEVGLHGIDAWRNSESACSESSRIREVTGNREIGVRMHWLYWNNDSAKAIERAGLKYDSTCGYNDAIGFWAGTTQPFSLWNAESLLEVPLNIQDTALFYPDRMALSENEALNACKELIHRTSLFGGVLTLNWHTRSLSPERLWGDFYLQLLQQIQKYRVLFGTVMQVEEWFRARRALRFECVRFNSTGVHVSFSKVVPHSGPPFVIRVHLPRPTGASSAPCMNEDTYQDVEWNGKAGFKIPYEPHSHEVQHCS